jgi:hypothetical protein
VLIFKLIHFESASEFPHETLEFLDFHFVFDLLVGNCPKVLSEISLVLELGYPLQIFVIEFEIAVDDFLEEQFVVLYEGVQTVLGFQGSVVGVSRVGDLLTQVVNDFIKCAEMRNILANQGFGIRVPSFLHQVE